MIWALSPAIPSGFWMKSIVGNDRISPSRTIAKMLEDGLGARELVGPDLAAAGESRVISWNLSPPSSVNCSVTIGSPAWPKSERVPRSSRSSPTISGTGSTGSFGRYSKR